MKKPRIETKYRHKNNLSYDPIRNGNPTKDENVYPVKNISDRRRMKRNWLKNKRTGRRNYTLFKLGIVTGLRASDLTRLKWRQIYNQHGNPRDHIYAERDKKTRKYNHYLDIKPVHDLLVIYHSYVLHNVTKTPIYMFGQLRNPLKHISAHSLYVIMRRAGEAIGLDHCGSHSIRKTSGYIAYTQTHNLGYVMKKLNQTDPSVTLRYIGVDRASMDKITESIDWN